MKKTTSLKNLALLTSFSLMLGCSSIHTPQTYELTAPAEFNQKISSTTQAEKDWWKTFSSPYLVELIDAALENNPDILIATENIIQAELALRKTGASRYPDLKLNAGTSSNYSAKSDTPSNTSNRTNAGLSASYEIDIWHKNAAAIRSSESLLDASEFDYQAAKLSLISNVAQTYFELLSQAEQIEITEKNIEIAQRLFEITQVKYENGVATSLDISRQKTALLNQQAAIIPLKSRFVQTQSALAVLTGKAPQEFIAQLEKIEDLTLYPPTPGIPFEVLQRRPDIAASEARLNAQDSNIHQAKANRWPALTLNASGDLSTSSLFSLADPTRGLGISLGLVQSLFDAGKNKSEVQVQESKYREAELGHYKNILNALLEVENALNTSQSLEEQEVAQVLTLAEAKNSLELSEFRYKEGADSLNTVLDTQKSLFQSQEQLLQIKQQRLSSIVDLYKVLGGEF